MMPNLGFDRHMIILKPRNKSNGSWGQHHEESDNLSELLELLWGGRLVWYVKLV